MSAGERIDLAAARERLAGLRGPRFWRGLEELAGSPGFREMLEREFPAGAEALDDPAGRRRFLKLMGASLAMAGVACTRQPLETIVPYVQQPEEIVPGRPLTYATAMPLGGYGFGVLAEAHMGRPTKIEGNPDHPASLGATSAFMQASVLSLYDPDRAQTVRHLGEIRPWGDFLEALRAAIEAQRPERGAGLRLLTRTVTSPTLAAAIAALRESLPEMRWHQHEAASRDAARAGARLAFGVPVETRYRLEQADVILALDADLLGAGPGHLRYAREFSRRRRVDGGGATRNRLYVVESMPTSTGAMADHRLPLRSSDVEAFAEAVAAAVGASARGEGGGPRDWIAAAARDLRNHRGRSAVVAGDGQPPRVHALAHAINEALGNAGRTVVHTDAVEAEPVDQIGSIRDLVRDMSDGRVRLLVILGGDPAFDAPADLGFAAAMDRVGLRVHLADHDDETAARCHWSIPRAHYLESWGDVRAFDGTASILQPLIEPLWGGRTDAEIVAVLAGRPTARAHDLVREHWAPRLGPGFEAAWRRALHDGLVRGTELPARSVAVSPGWDRGAGPAPRAGAGDLEIVLRPDPTIWDGRFANNGWLQELPKPITRLTWDNAAIVSPATAGRLGVASEDVIELRVGGRAVRAPVWVQPGHAGGSVTVHFGYGRRRAGRVAEGAGFDAYPLRAAAAPWFALGLEVARTGERYPLACTQIHHAMEGRDLVRAADLAHFREHPDFARHIGHEPGPEETLYPPDHPRGDYAWGMSIDLNACIGCGACVVACQAENNIPVVGKEQVAVGREMHWLRVDRYYEGDLDNPRVLHQPVPCMHCENAPCELVCPVGATVHSSEGLNDMVYNRCVGTRYCSNNCPYKVRRFNFFNFHPDVAPTLKMLANPDVTVRGRGVMEKCTYCVQRINGARITARREDRRIRDGEVVTACQAACPAEAIAFGDIGDPASDVARRKADPRSYGILTELGTRPRTTYLAAVRNPNPALAGPGHGEGEG
jgi:molybdopterin-containing oxidoreductase family iron-sulfur binding subunit